MQDTLTSRKLVLAERLIDCDVSSLSGVLDAMTLLLGADVALLSLGRPGHPPRVCLSTAGNATRLPALSVSCSNPENELKPLCEVALMQPAGHLYAARELATEASLAQSAYLLGWRQNSPFSDCCAGYVRGNDGEICQLGFGILGAATTGRVFEQTHLAALDSLLPRFAARLCSLAHTRLLEALCASFVNRYDRYHIGVMVIDMNGFVLFRNDQAQSLLDQQDGLRLRGSRLEFSPEGNIAGFMALVREHAASANPDGSFVPHLFPIPREHRRDLTLAIGRWGSRGLPGEAVCPVLIFDAERPQIDRRDTMRVIYNLTDREASLLAAVAEGESLERFAERTQCSEVAARSALKRIFRKTGTSRQAEVVKLILTGPAAMVS